MAGPARSIGGVLVALPALVALASLPAAAGERFKRLDETGIRKELIGKDITDGYHWSYYLRRDGALLSVSMGKQRSGSWKIEDGQLCLSSKKGDPFECHEVWLAGREVSFRASKDDVDFAAIVQPHTAD
jgi:hypothetical protein